MVGGAHFEPQKGPKRKAVPIDSQQEDSLNVDLTLYSLILNIMKILSKSHCPLQLKVPFGS